MADSRSSSEEVGSRDGEWVPYFERPEWKDVTPVPQNDGPFPVVQIAYTDRYKDVYDYFRAVLKSGEKSQRVLELSEDAVELNPANYSVWHFRREVLKALGSDIKEELQYCREIIEEYPKNYQVWQHRRVLVEWLNDPSREIRFTEIILSQDQKNYHAWQHRQWVLQTFKLFDQEIEYIDRLLEEDVRNNSAWNQRFFVVSHSTGWTAEVVEKEVNYTLAAIKRVPRNESAWNYLRGILDHGTDPGSVSSARATVTSSCEELLSSGCTSPYLLGFVVELQESVLEGGAEDQGRDQAISRIQGLCKVLAEEHDTIRKNYWNYISQSLSGKYGRDE